MSRTSDYLGAAAGPATFGPQIGGGLVAYPSEVYESPSLDLTVPNLGIELIPAKPAHVPVLLNQSGIGVWIVIEAVAGTQTAAGTFIAGSNPAHTNYLTSVGLPPNTSINATDPILAVPSAQIMNAFTPTSNTLQRFPNTPVILDVTVGSSGTGGFALRGRIITVAYWLPAGG
jgi:hypothetical protein